jgi:hypothetical protein
LQFSMLQDLIIIGQLLKIAQLTSNQQGTGSHNETSPSIEN